MYFLFGSVVVSKYEDMFGESVSTVPGIDVPLEVSVRTMRYSLILLYPGVD